MTVPGQILVRADSSYWNADAESVITFGTYGDDDFSLAFDVIDSDYSRWEPNEVHNEKADSNSPKFPQRRRSMVAVAPAVDLPKIPRRKQSVIVTSTGSTSIASKLSFASPPAQEETPVSQLPALTQRQLPLRARGIAPPRPPCRKSSTEASPSPSFSDICKQYPNRKCKSSPPNKRTAKAA